MHGLFNRITVQICILTIACGYCFGQASTSAEPTWVRLTDDKLGFAISFPSEFLVDNENDKGWLPQPFPIQPLAFRDMFEKPRVVAGQRSVYFSLSVFQLRHVPSAKNYLWFFADKDRYPDETQDFSRGQFYGRTTNLSKDKTLSRKVAIASKDKVFLIYAFANKEDQDVYDMFLKSLTLNGEPLFAKNASEIPPVSKTASLSSLKTSTEVMQALQLKQSSIKYSVTEGGSSAKSESSDDRLYSRPMLILRSPRPLSPDPRLWERITGEVILSVNLMANGDVGDIEIVKGLPNGVTEQCIRAVRNIKFLPAEVDGVKVDTKRTFTFAFNRGQ